MEMNLKLNLPATAQKLDQQFHWAKCIFASDAEQTDPSV
jgi:hypothetical protein